MITGKKIKKKIVEMILIFKKKNLKFIFFKKKIG